MNSHVGEVTPFEIYSFENAPREIHPGEVYVLYVGITDKAVWPQVDVLHLPHAPIPSRVVESGPLWYPVGIPMMLDHNLVEFRLPLVV